MNKREKEFFQLSLEAEEDILHELEEQYQESLNQINEKIRLLQSNELTKSKIYQLEYQKALKGQIEGIIEKMHGDQYITLQEYLSNSYTDAFIGTMYNIAGQGIPLMIPIDQAAAVKAIITDSKISKGLYASLGVDANKLKKAIRQEITRGISTAMTYEDIARNISNVSKAPLSRAKTIARTEGHRIQQASTMDAQTAAKSRGADVVKMWDATLDGRTRSTHRQLDGQIREVEEPFELGRKKAMYPGDFGDPAEDCNCRCASLTRAKWALDEDELQTLKDRAEYFGIDKSDSFEDYKKKYLKAVEKQKKISNDSWIQTADLPPSTNEFDDWDEYKKAMNAYKGGLKYVADSEWNNHHVYDEAEMQNAKRFDATIAQLQEKYPLVDEQRLIIGDYDVVQHNLTTVQRERISDEARAQQWINPDTNTAVIGFRPNETTTTFEDDLLRRQQTIDKGEILSDVFFNSAEGTAIHEYGHVMSEHLTKGVIYDDPNAMEYWNWYKSLDKDDIRKGLSEYAATNRYEFEAEAFAELQTGNPRPLAKKFGEYLDKLIGKSYDVSGDTEEGIIEKYAKKIDTSSIKTVILPKDEYAHVMSEIATNLSERQKSQSIVTKAIGKYSYTFENNGFGEYRIIGKKLIDEDVVDWWSD